MNYELGIVGAGNMAEAIVRAILENQIIEPRKIIVSDPSPQRRAVFEAMDIVAIDDNSPVVAQSSAVMLAVKPQTLSLLTDDLRQITIEHQIVLSIMAGVTTAKLEAVIGRPARIVRIMPNTPLMVGAGMSAIALGSGAREGDGLLALQIFRAAGEAVLVDESQLDAVTAMSGSGPAYVFYLAEAMIEAGSSLGLSPELAKLLAQQTILGAAKLLVESGQAPDELRAKVTSPGGTTQAAIEHLENQSVRSHIVRAIGRAAERSAELGK